MARLPSPDGRLRLAVIGGTARWKGLHLVKCTLFSTAFAHLHLTIIDYDRPPGEQRNELWNTTPVEILPKYPEERVTELYARIDILLAPSIAAAGSWVPTGEASASASAMKKTASLSMLPTQDTLIRVLSVIDGNPAGYLKATRGAIDAAAGAGSGGRSGVSLPITTRPATGRQSACI